MSKSKGLFKNLRGFLWVVIFAAIVYLVIRNIHVFGNILLVLLGFGAVVIVHEFGYFIVAKLSDIKVEAFSIFMPPTLLGVRKTKDGFRFRILPGLFSKENDESDESQAKLAPPQDAPRQSGVEARDEQSLPRAESRPGTRVGETEYRIGLIPFGGFVKMLGQEDTGPVKSSDDPRSFANKPVSKRIPVIAAGVIFNCFSAVIIFMIVFLFGIKLMPPIVGSVVPNSPAAQAELKPGDEIIEITGKSKDLDFSNILVAAALSEEGEEVPLKVRHEDGSKGQIRLVAEQLPGEPLRAFGINQPMSLTVADVSDSNTLLTKTGLLPGDSITHISGRGVQSYWQMEEILQNTFAPKVAIEAQRADGLVKTQIPLDLRIAGSNEIESESELYNVHSIVPRLRVVSYVGVPDTVTGGSGLRRIGRKLLALIERVRDRIYSVLGKPGEVEDKPEPPLRAGDVILAVGDVNNPTYKELRESVTRHKGKELPMKVLRADANGIKRPFMVTVTPKQPEGSERGFIGVQLALDAEHPVVAKTIAVEDGPPKLEIPRGAMITAVDGERVSNFYDIVRQIRQNAGKPVTIDYSLDGQAGSVSLNIGAGKEDITVKSAFTEYIPFKPLEVTYQASGPVHAVAMGYRRTVMFVAQTYVTLKRLIGGVVSPKHLMGPVGIITFSYRVVAEEPLIKYFYFLGLISAVIAVFNLLPLPPLDGGLIVLMLVEKIKGSALSERAQGAIAYAGWVLIGTLLLYVTFNDIVRSFFS